MNKIVKLRKKNKIQSPPQKHWKQSSDWETTSWIVSKYQVISGPYFPAFGQNTERYTKMEHFVIIVNSFQPQRFFQSIATYSIRMRENTDQK